MVMIISTKTYPPHPYHPYRSYIVVAVAIVAVVLAIIVSQSSSNKDTSSLMDSSSISTFHTNKTAGHIPSIKYVEKQSGRTDVKRYAAVHNTNEPVSTQSWMSLVHSDSTVGLQAASALSKIIAESPYDAMLFETPGTTWKSSPNDQFEFALVDMPSLAKFAELSPDQDAFQKHFTSTCYDQLNFEELKYTCTFPNLGGDAILVAPVPPMDTKLYVFYSHLAIFIRHAPEKQVSEFWRVAASTYLDTMKKKALKVFMSTNNTDPRNNTDQQQTAAKTWFSTNGMGVAWLHLRIDDRPKYYSYAPFKK